MHTLTIGKSILWVVGYFCVMLFYTAIDMTVWRVIAPSFSVWLNIIFSLITIIVFIYIMVNKTKYKVNILENISVKGVMLAIGCSILLFLILDNMLDPIFESIFPTSELAYQETINTIVKSPITSFIQVCLIPPIVEEILIRGFILSGLNNKYGAVIAILISSILFALLHFNMVQTLSAFICGVLLGLLYLKTKSIFSCIVAHFGYNLISFVAIFIF